MFRVTFLVGVISADYIVLGNGSHWLVSVLLHIQDYVNGSWPFSTLLAKINGMINPRYGIWFKCHGSALL